MIKMRDFSQRDIPPLLELLHADQLPAQPRTTAHDVQCALAGQTTIDQKWWEALAGIRTIVATQGNDILGAASYGVQKTDRRGTLQPDGSGCLLWLHARENRPVIEALLAAVLASLQECPRVYAFWFATPLTVGIEGLPLAHRPVTHQVLCEHHFVGKDDWLYMAGPITTQAEQVADVERTAHGWKLSLQEGDERIAEADVSLGKNRLGVLHWLWVREDRRGHGLGTRLFFQARKLLSDAGAHTVLLFVDHDDPVERDRTPAIRLYQRHGFEVIDHLWSYWRGTPPPWLATP
ncbi:MAG: GNAT family N-acetyltransferase [Ktedonobacteraceae bacterium]|nr:GNAT family N-acetyltransferase [Ktedonobacteraceae bacterium]